MPLFHLCHKCIHAIVCNKALTIFIQSDCDFRHATDHAVSDPISTTRSPVYIIPKRIVNECLVSGCLICHPLNRLDHMRMRSYHQINAISNKNLCPFFLHAVWLQTVFCSPMRAHYNKIRLFSGGGNVTYDFFLI